MTSTNTTSTLRRPERLVVIVLTALLASLLTAWAAPAAHAAPTPLVGLFKLQAGVQTGTSAPTGSYFRMLQPDGEVYLANANSRAADKTYTVLRPGTDGGLRTGAYQPAPATQFDAAGNSLATRVTAPEAFFGVRFSTATNAKDPQTGTNTVAPTISANGTALTGDLRAFAASWNKQHFNQGAPKPNGTLPGHSQAVSGTYNPTTKAFHITWRSLIVGGPFNNFTGEWHLVGTFVPTGVAPTFTKYVRTASSFSVNIANHEAGTTYALATSAGKATRSGLTVTVSGLKLNQKAKLWVTAKRAGVADASRSITGAALARGVAPTFGRPTSVAGGWVVSISNFNTATTYTVTANYGKVKRDRYKITAYGVVKGKSTTVTVIARRPGFTTTAAKVTGTAR